MIKKLSYMANGETYNVELPSEASAIRLEADGMDVSIESARYNQKVHVTTYMNELSTLNRNSPPDIYLTVADIDRDGKPEEGGTFIRRTDALLYISYNGRIIGKDQTHGSACVEKPIATKPWVNPNYRGRA